LTAQGGGNLSQTNTGDRLVTVLNVPMDNERTAITRDKMGETFLPQREKSFEYKGFSTSSPAFSYHCMSWILAALIKGEMG